MHRILLFLFCLAVSPIAVCQVDEKPISQPPSSEELHQVQLLNDGANLLKQGHPQTAISDYFEKSIAYYQDKYKDSTEKIFCARTPQEALLYVASGAKDKVATRVISPTWSTAYYMKAYALIELGRIDEAQENLKRAIALSPRNSQYLSELGNSYQSQKNWPMAIENFVLAEAAAREFSPAGVKNGELARAWRGLGFAYTEQNRWDDAEKLYRQCLELDPNDTKAKSELLYLQQLRSKQRGTASNSSQVDILKINDAYVAFYIATLKCDPGVVPNMTNILLMNAKAAQELRNENPGFADGDIQKLQSGRWDRVKKTVEDQIAKRGCDATDIRQLRENFIKVTARN